jgi:hypothetical protein
MDRRRRAPFRLLWVVAGLCAAGALLQACSGLFPSSEAPPSEVGPGDRIYHVQLQLTDEKAQAVETQGRAQRWWQQSRADYPPLLENTPSSDPPVTIAWQAPFYRVRLGPFATEAQADSVLAAAQPAFPDAFVAPDRIQPTPARK